MEVQLIAKLRDTLEDLAPRIRIQIKVRGFNAQKSSVGVQEGSVAVDRRRCHRRLDVPVSPKAW